MRFRKWMLCLVPASYDKIAEAIDEALDGHTEMYLEDIDRLVHRWPPSDW